MSIHSESHLESHRLQALAEGEASEAEVRDSEGHLVSCARCRAELDGWRFLFDELGELPDLGPSPDFVERVMAEVRTEAPARVRLADRVRALLPGGGTTRERQHLSAGGIQSYLEGLLDRGVMAKVDVHLRACGACRTEVEHWKPVFAALRGLPRFEPSPHFAERVMERVPVAAIAEVSRIPEPSLGRRLMDAGRKLVPATPRGWTLAGGLAAAPAVGMTVAVATVVLHPLLSLQDVAVFLRWQATEVATSLWAWSLGTLTETPMVYWAMESLVSIGQTPGVAFAGLAAIWGATLASCWVLYRYIIAPSLSTGHHAQPS